mgnify:CR=1 FL=1
MGFRPWNKEVICPEEMELDPREGVAQEQEEGEVGSFGEGRVKGGWEEQGLEQGHRDTVFALAVGPGFLTKQELCVLTLAVPTAELEW